MRNIMVFVFVSVFACIIAIFLLTHPFVTPKKIVVSKPQSNTTLQKNVAMVKVGETRSGIALKLEEKVMENGDKSITVRLVAKDYTAFDAIDAEVTFTNVVAKCTQGDATPLYPRFQVAPTSLTLTGVASVDSKHIYFGNSNSILFHCDLHKVNAKEQAQFMLNKRNTHIYSLGNEITDTSGSFKDLIW